LAPKSKTPRILWGHILPNILGPLIVAETLTIPTYISYEAFLSSMKPSSVSSG